MTVEAGHRHGLYHEKGLGLPKDPESTLGISLRSRRLEQSIIPKIFPSRPIVAAVGEEAVEEGHRVIVIAHPRSADEVVIQRRHFGEVGLPLEGPQFNPDPQVFPEHGLDLHAGLLVDPRPDIEGVFNGWKPPPFGISGLG